MTQTKMHIVSSLSFCTILFWEKRYLHDIEPVYVNILLSDVVTKVQVLWHLQCIWFYQVHMILSTLMHRIYLKGELQECSIWLI